MNPPLVQSVERLQSRTRGARMFQFERVNQKVDGHTVTITSWYDAKAGAWRASAPAHIHLLHNVIGPITGGSRQQVIGRVAETLRQAFMSGLTAFTTGGRSNDRKLGDARH